MKKIKEKISFLYQNEWGAHLIFLIIFFLAFRKLWSAGMLAYGDSPPFPENFSQAWGAFSSSFQPLIRGITNPQTMTTSLQGVFDLLFLNGRPDLAQKLFHFLPFLIAYFASFRFVKNFTQSNFARFVGAFIYTVNPATLGAFIGGAIGLLYVHAFLPLLVVFMEKLTKREGRLLNFLIFTALYALAFNFGAYIHFLLLPIFLYFLTNLLLKKKIFASLEFAGLIMAAFAGTIILNLPFAFYSIPFIARFFLPAAANNNAAVNTAGLIEEVRATYKDDPMLNIGLGGTFANIPNLLSFFPYGYIIPILAFSALFLVKNKEKLSQVLLLSLFVIAMFSFMVATHFGLTFKLFQEFPNLLIFRSPAKLVMYMALGLAGLSAISLGEIIKRTKEKARLFFGLILILILGVLCLYSWPFIGFGDLGLRLSKPKGQLTIPASYYQISNWLSQRQKDEGPFRTLWEPWDYEATEIKIKWLDENVFAVPLGYSSFAYSDIVPYIKAVEGPAIFDKKGIAAKFLAYTYIKYIVVTYEKPTEAVDFEKFWREEPNIKQVYPDTEVSGVGGYKTADFIIFQNLDFQPKIRAYTQTVNFPTNISLIDSLMGELKKEPKFNPSSVLLTNSILNIEELKETLATVEILKTTKKEILVRTKAEQPFILFLAEPYHPDWQALNQGGTWLEHFPAFYQNGFVVPGGKQEISINYKGENARQATIFIWLISWFLLIGALSTSWLWAKKGPNQKELKQDR